MVVVGHVDGILAHAIDRTTMRRSAMKLGDKFRPKNRRDARFYMFVHPHHRQD